MRSVTHSSLTNRLEHGQHKGYVPGAYDPVTGLTNPTRRGAVRGWWNHPDAVAGPGGLLAHLKPFTGHSIRALWRNGAYYVYSYSTCIAWYYPPEHVLEISKPAYGTAGWYDRVTPANEPTPKLYLDDSYYGPTTSKHQGMVNAWMGQAIPEAMGIDPELDS